MTFEKDSVRHLFIWVHPDYGVIRPEILDRSNEFIDEIASNPDSAVIELPVYERPRTLEKLSNTNLGSTSDPRYFCSIKEFEVLETKALGVLGDRFLVYPFDGFVDSKKNDQVDFLVKYYNVTPRARFDLFNQEQITLFERISVFGEMPDSCVNDQYKDALYLGAKVMPFRNTPPFVGEKFPISNSFESLPLHSMLDK